jgi:hypothetical protein
MLVLKVNRAFSAGAFWGAMNPGALPQACDEYCRAFGAQHIPARRLVFLQQFRDLHCV